MLTYDETLASYTRLLEQNPGKALKLDNDSAVVLVNGNLLCGWLVNGSIDMNDLYGFALRGALFFKFGVGGWDDDAEGTQAAISTPVFLDVPGPMN